LEWLYRIGLVIAGCYVESAIRNASGVVLYWAGKSEILQGFVPYIVPVVLGYLLLLDLEKHWSNNRLKNDVMGYTVAVLLTGYPLLVTLSMWINSDIADPTSVPIRYVASALLAVGVLATVLFGRSAARKGVPLSMPWGTVTGRAEVPQAEGGGTEAEEPEAEEPRSEQPRFEEPEAEEPESEVPRSDEPKPEEPKPGKLTSEEPGR
jgi:hypothetical protein